MSEMHLTDEQFADLLSDDSASEARRHLDVCLGCREELARVQASLGSFDAMTLEWAERRAPMAIEVPRAGARRWFVAPAWNAAAAGFLVAAVLFGLHTENSSHATGAANFQAAGAASEGATLAEDNQLMADIDREVQTQHASPVAVSELGLGKGRSRERSAKEGSQ